MTHFLQRSALILLGTTALVACSSTGEALRPAYPSRVEQAPPPPPPIETAPPVIETTPLPQAAPPPLAVESQPLPPLVTAPPTAQPTPAPAPPPVVQRTQPAPAPTFQTVTRRSVTGRVVNAPGKPVTYEIKKGDTLEKIARKLDTTVEALRKDNKLRKSVIQPGDTLKGPAKDAKAYVVGSGDTFFSIGKRFTVSVDALRDENGLGSRAALHSGQRLRLPAGYRDRGPQTVTERISTGAAVAAPEADFQAYEAPLPQAARPQPAQTTTRRTVTGRVIEIPGEPVRYTVRKGDNLSKIARKLDTTVDDLKDDNRLKSSEVHPGQTLKGPRTSAKAYVAGADDTLAEIARRFGVKAETLRSRNGLNRNASIRAGQRIRLPDGYRDRGPIVTRTVTTPAVNEEAPPRTPVREAPAPTPRPSLPVRPQPYTPPPSTPRVSPSPPIGSIPAYIPPPAPLVGDAQISQMGRGRFIWPLQGQILSAFGPKPGGQKNDGINLQADSGAVVRAAASGMVVYAGDQVPGFGNLVLIQHADGWVTAYGHLSRVDVKGRQQIAQGQQVGLAGATGGAVEPQLHFEIRYAPSPKDRAQPIDPRLVLPR